MDRARLLDRTLSAVGVVLAAFPLLAMVGLGLVASWSQRTLLVDWFLPAELLPVHLAGAAGLAFVAFRSRRRRWPIVAGVLAQIVALVLVQAAASATGLATGDRAPQGWPLALVVGLFAVFFVAHVATVVSGVLLARDARRDAPDAGSPDAHDRQGSPGAGSRGPGRRA